MEAIDYEPSAALIDAILGYGEYDEDDLYYGSDAEYDYPGIENFGFEDSDDSESSLEPRLPPNDLRNPKYFPSFVECAPVELYEDSDNERIPPPRHWCYLGEIVKGRTAPLRRNGLIVEDKEGEETHLSAKFDLKASRFDAKVGSTIAILYAERKRFAPGVYGLRLNHAKFVKIFPCNLKTLLRINDDLDDVAPVNSPKKCQQCGKEEDPELPEKALLRCAQCLGVSYCGKECQIAAWKRGHSRECKVFAAVFELKTSRDWGNRYPHQWVACGEREELPPPTADSEVELGTQEI
ncbi:hypothetical protein C8R46DRAFT_981484 [Mycena filopes]|nr:hypothetical protein C8R46DRAFT_981484 [Mycena filopes]